MERVSTHGPPFEAPKHCPCFGPEAEVAFLATDDGEAGPDELVELVLGAVRPADRRLVQQSADRVMAAGLSVYQHAAAEARSRAPLPVAGALVHRGVGVGVDEVGGSSRIADASTMPFNVEPDILHADGGDASAMH